MKEQGAVIYSVPVNDASRFHEWSMDEEGITTCFGGEIFYQAGATIVTKNRAWFNPVHVVGVVRE
ncbi:MAG: hypothetical protein CUN57_04160 [Phototrophicales bacterium]|nr:MAG: hypothetical protein CUN57_04160 [Phototrophicales bacterium]